MKFEIKCLCGMNVSASLNATELENEGTATTTLPIIATEDNGIGGILVNAEEKAMYVKCTNCNKSARFLLEVDPPEAVNLEESPEIDWSEVSFVKEGN